MTRNRKHKTYIGMNGEWLSEAERAWTVERNTAVREEERTADPTASLQTLV